MYLIENITTAARSLYTSD